jgi:hypothetical protein
MDVERLPVPAHHQDRESATVILMDSNLVLEWHLYRSDTRGKLLAALLPFRSSSFPGPGGFSLPFRRPGTEWGRGLTLWPRVGSSPTQTQGV